MELKFEAAYKQLNNAQKQAVDNIEGPMLVVAGPGTGKTQLLSLRVANILRLTDAAPGNILCLTFTDNAARNMRERLQSTIGQSSYHVSIHTFHSFGSELISRYPDLFSDRQMLQQIDEIGRYELLQDIFETLPYSNPLSVKAGEDFVFIEDTLSVISMLKQNALTPRELRNILEANQKVMDIIDEPLASTFSASPSPKLLNNYVELLKQLESLVIDQSYYGFPDYALTCADELEAAIDDVSPGARFAPSITAWRNSWCQKDSSGNHVLKDAGRNLKKMQAVANVYEQLISKMADLGLYDFDDMIVEAVHGLETNPELRFTVQERIQYILVDEFQDTNKAQLRLLKALGDNPVNEQRPNIMAVGDDDQAIYSFQGASSSNMVAFIKAYRDPTIVTLVENYRSTSDILSASFSVADQISDRLEAVLPDTHKALVAQANHKINLLSHSSFSSELAQYDYIAEQVSEYIKKGTSPDQIAIIAPRHRYLERLMPYLGNRKLPVAYERRENILDSPIVIQLLTMAKLIVALANNQQVDVDDLMSKVLSYDFWDVDNETLIKTSLEAYDKRKHWLEILSSSNDKKLKAILNWFVGLAKKSELEPLEYMLDQLMGGISDGIDSEFDDLLLPSNGDTGNFISPMRQFYFNSDRYETATDSYLTLLGQLSTLRSRLRQWKPIQALYIRDLVEFAELYNHTNLKIIDTNPHTQSTNAVQVMTAYKAKGLEFEVVFVINLQDEIWGPTARSRSSSISLPRNLPIAPASDGDNDKLRLLFVALSRAKHTLQLTSYSETLENKPSLSLSFLINEAGEPVYPGFSQIKIDKPLGKKPIEILTTDWAYRYRNVIADKPALFKPILDNYKLSITHLNNYLDIVNGGPSYFMLHNLLRFPQAPTPSAAYGDSIHKTLQWAHVELSKNNSLPKIESITNYFSDILSRKQLRKSDLKRLNERGELALLLYFKDRPEGLIISDIIERGFNNEGVVISGANLSGKIDKLHFENRSSGLVEVIDFKTGKPASSWQGKDEFERIKLHKYRQQLLFYKLLVENSSSFENKLKVSKGALEFIESNEQTKLVPNLVLEIKDEELEHFIKLLDAVWQHIMSLKFPDVSNYSQNLKGMQKFEQDLIDGLI
jgi:DNA helicase-2/ATP-dependent DNA helicase PcrA